MDNKNNLYEINKADNMRHLFYSFISVLAIIIVTALIYFFATRSSSVVDDSSAEQSSVAESSLIEESSQPPQESTEESSVEEVSEESSVEESSQPETQEPQYKDHQWVINSMGYTYLYYDKGLEEFTYTNSLINSFADLINRLNQKIGSEKFYNIIIPTQAGFIDFPTAVTSSAGDGFKAASQKNYITAVGGALDEGIENIEIFDLFKEKYASEEYIFFNTDTNYTALGAYYAYSAFAAKASFTPMSLDLLSPLTFTGFLGQFYNATKADRLYDNSDTIYYYNIDEAYPASVSFYKGGELYRNRQLVYKDAAPANGYFVFLGTNASRFEITTQATSGKSILVIGDTSASAFVPYLASEYTNITFINPQYFTEDFDEILASASYDETLLISYSTTYNKTYYQNYLKALLGD